MNERALALERRLEWPMLVISVLVVLGVFIDLAMRAEPWPEVAAVINGFCWFAFLIEWLATMRVASDRRAWLATHKLETAIVFLAVPVLLPWTGTLRLLRIARLLRLVWVAKYARRAFTLDGLPYVALVALLAVIGAGAAYSIVEQTPQRHMSVWGGLWWAASTVTTVGYGDESPETTAGKFLAVGVMMIGIGFVALLSTAVAGVFLETAREGPDEHERHDELLDHLAGINARLDALEQSIAQAEEPGDEYADPVEQRG